MGRGRNGVVRFFGRLAIGNRNSFRKQFSPLTCPDLLLAPCLPRLDEDQNMETSMNLRSKVLVFACGLSVLIGMGTVGGLRLAHAQPRPRRTAARRQSGPSGFMPAQRGKNCNKSPILAVLTSTRSIIRRNTIIRFCQSRVRVRGLCCFLPSTTRIRTSPENTRTFFLCLGPKSKHRLGKARR